MALTKFMLLLLLVLSLCFPFKFCTSTDTITQNQFIRDPETIISAQNTFRFGFFSPINTTYRYVGIFYTISVSTAIWVANRNNPLEDNSGIVNISEDGNLVVINGQNEVIWSSNVSNSMLNSTAQLLDTGNLVLRDNISGRTIWESFQNPTDSFLQGMRLSTDTNTGRRNILTSWQSPSNPSIGSFSVGVVVHLSIAEIFVWNRSSPYWRSGPRSEQTFIEIPGKDSVALNGFNVVDDREGTVYLTYTYTNESILTYLFLNSEGNLTQRFWRESRQDWEVSHSSMNNECKVYGKCGPFGSCDSSKRPICSCLRGFEAKNTEEWRRGNWSSGCIRRTPLQCERNSSTSEADGFLKMTITKVPVFPEWSPASEDNCGSHCLRNCSCMAYAYHSGIGCMQWSGNLIDIQKVYNGVTDFYVRLAYSELEKKKNMTLIISLPVIVGSLVVLVCAYFSWKWMAKRRGYSAENKIPANANRMKIKELPLFSLKQVVNATNNFHAANKLGEGGFGPVYKGNLPDGQEIAVKRLSRSSHQGSEEFMNEVLLISKLQHRNLVRLLGCCVEEKMLIYEYMPNKSLDGFLFESTKQEVLDWKKRVNIVEGIGRGLLYLHRDSRLRIIHRDLKTNNILLDEELNPKISDFGMARIFGGKQDQAKTRRVVGTYGYMAPEYAMHGRFSEKIDVYSFGVLILEIVSGKKNTSFYHHELSLVNYAWKLWNQGESIAFVDPNINDASCEMEMLRHIHVGLLCVQESPKDRPTVSAVLSMLSSETSDLPTPRHPAFSGEEASSDKTSHMCSSNNVSITIIEAR